MYCGRITKHTKKRGILHICDWCGQRIFIGESYETWLYFDGGRRATVYAHEECSDAWHDICREESGIVEVNRDQDRPKNAALDTLRKSLQCV